MTWSTCSPCPSSTAPRAQQWSSATASPSIGLSQNPCTPQAHPARPTLRSLRGCTLWAAPCLRLTGSLHSSSPGGAAAGGLPAGLRGCYIVRLDCCLDAVVHMDALCDNMHAAVHSQGRVVTLSVTHCCQHVTCMQCSSRAGQGHWPVPPWWGTMAHSVKTSRGWCMACWAHCMSSWWGRCTAVALA